jgi:hypothetical protein
MKSLLITATVVTAATVLAGCPYQRQPQPVPGPQSSRGPQARVQAAHGGAVRAAIAREPQQISWFQGSLEEAFARRPCPYS